MMYLIVQTWAFLLIAWLIGIVVGFGLLRDQKSTRHRDTEEQLRDARNRQIEMEKELEDFRTRVSEMEGLPQGVRASRVAAREEMVSRIATLEREIEAARASEKKLGDEAERLRSDVDGFRTRYLEARAKWDEYQAKTEALAAAPPQAATLNLGEAQVVRDDGMRQRVVELEKLLVDAARMRDRVADQAKTLSARVSELEAQLANAGKAGTGGGDEAKPLKDRIAYLESQLLVASVDDTAAEEAKALKARVGELESSLAAASKSAEQGKLLQARVGELEGRLASGFAAARESDTLKSRIADLQDKLGEAEVALRKAISAPKADAEPLKARIGELEAQLAALQANGTPGGAEALTLKSVSEATALRSRVAELEAKLAEAPREAGEVAALRAKLAEFEGKGKSLLAASNEEDLRRMQARTVELEKALEKSRAQASEAQSLRAQVAALETRLAAQHDERGSSGEDVSLLKARLADVEARLMTSSSASMEFDSLRNRVMTLEALLHEAAKSRDEAAILRSKVAELDGRLGQAMKAVADTRPRATESEKV